MIVEFSDVGRGKRTWQSDVSDDLNQAGDELVNEVLRHGGLMSSDVDVSLDLGTGEGMVLVGGFRCVGRVKLLGEVPDHG